MQQVKWVFLYGYFAKKEVLSYGYPLGMFGVTFGAISRLIRVYSDLRI